jgi:hypothetical protein
MNNPRIVCNFSCGAASAVATKLAISQYKKTHELIIVNAFIKEEHSDNRRFLADCEKWFDHKIMILRDTDYGASTHEVWKKQRFLVSKNGAPCSKRLKRDLLESIRKINDIVIVGFTAEENNRYDRILSNNAEFIDFRAPLIEHGLKKEDCFALLQDAGLELPMMYRLGYHNANCIGCPKGGQGYWNKIRIDFPEIFESVATIQESLGEGANFFRDRETDARFSLRELLPTMGRYQSELKISCGFFCEIAKQDINEI